MAEFTKRHAYVMKIPACDDELERARQFRPAFQRVKKGPPTVVVCRVAFVEGVNDDHRVYCLG